MKIFLSPIVGEEKITYTFEGETITAEYQGVVDEFDFEGLPDGVMKTYDDLGNEVVKTDLPLNPILSAEKKEGILEVVLLNFIDTDATEEERFPEWIDAKDYKPKETEFDENGENGVAE